jgi:hypothetical protein
MPADAPPGSASRRRPRSPMPFPRRPDRRRSPVRWRCRSAPRARPRAAGGLRRSARPSHPRCRDPPAPSARPRPHGRGGSRNRPGCRRPCTRCSFLDVLHGFTCRTGWRDILELIGDGHSNKDIARAIGIAPETVKTHVKNIFAKLDVQRRAQAVTFGGTLGLKTPFAAIFAPEGVVVTTIVTPLGKAACAIRFCR